MANTKARIEASIALARRVKATVSLPACSLDGAGIIDLVNFIDGMNEIVALCNALWPRPGVFAERDDGSLGVFCKQPGHVISEIGDWADRAIVAAYTALEAVQYDGSVEQSFRLEKLLGYYAGREEFEKCRELLTLQLPGDPVHFDSVEGRDRLDDGINLLHTTWLAMAGNTMEDSNFSKDREAVTDAVWQALSKFEQAKSKLAAAAKGRAA